MNHQQALSMRHEADQHDQQPDCAGELAYASAGFWDDVSWTVYRCQGCGQLIATVGGGRHWWNYVLSDESARRLFPYGIGGARDQVLAVAPWGDTYTAEDIENGRMPLEARYIGEDGNPDAEQDARDQAARDEARAPWWSRADALDLWGEPNAWEPPRSDY